MYNGAEYLSECIESILGQTYRNWECTIVDNCSTDESLEIAHRYASRDPRIRVHKNQQYLQVIANHNAALRQISATCKYCKVVFADDWIFPECLEKMVAIAEEYPSVGIVGAYCLEGQQVICTGLPYSRRLVDGREICRQHLLEKLHLFGSPNSLLYRADLVRSRDPFFNEANIHADTEVCFALLRACDFGFVHQVLTFTRLRSGSLNTVSNDLHAYFSGMLRIIGTYGPYYLTGEELTSYLQKELSAYYRFLGKSLFFGRDQKFWDFHKNNLIELSVGFSRTRLAMAVLANLWTLALRPKEAMERLFEGRKQRIMARRKPVLLGDPALGKGAK
jgi:glycosyltransferase involved in cell wall biosynthesis